MPLFIIALFAALGGFLFGYDVGVISGVLMTPSFVSVFQPMSALMQGTIVSMLIPGCILGSLLAGPLCERVGRKHSILLAALLLVVGVGIQAAAFDIRVLFAGRFVSGMSIGKLSVAGPLYLSEIAPSRIRGRVVSLQQGAVAIGIAVAFCVSYASNELVGDLAWRLPLGLQIIPAVILAIGTELLPQSPRWLLKLECDEDAKHNLSSLRSVDQNSSQVREELADIKRSILLERQTTTGAYLELFKAPMLKRTMLSLLIHACQQLTGISIVLYYSPTLFIKAGVSSVHASLVAQGICALVNVVGFLPSLFVIDTWGRRPTLIAGALIMACAMLTVGLVQVAYPIPSTNAAYVAASGIYVFVAAFSCSWGPVAWIYPAEIFPLLLRSKALSLATAINWLFNGLITLFGPILIQTLGFTIYFILASFLFVMAVTVFFLFPETKGHSLENTHSIFYPSHSAIENQATKRSPYNFSY
ncbi:hypothetical protein DSO57_1033062 [Entomophthora muscae]|uniref:Uncharacterized protein n=1 Tax=Entomophthora muscae TaxID=34485 RepID=A0ACC2SPZ4_9FUNG|nr:hypothetical protein DSO57_1033062 [Entomophthora muscae]